MDFLSNLVVLIKQLTPSLLLGIVLASGFGVFLPPEVLQIIGVDDLIKEHKKYIGLAFMASSSIVCAKLILLAFGFISKKIQAKIKLSKIKRKREEVLENVTLDEKIYLARYIIDQENTCYFDIKDGISGGLRVKNIIYAPSGFFGGSSLAHNLQPWARDYLLKNPNFFDEIHF